LVIAPPATQHADKSSKHCRPLLEVPARTTG
jgi:hypothetical protein